MKKIIFIITVCLALSLSCKNSNHDPGTIHQEDSSHEHVGDASHLQESETTHTHEADSVHTHEAESAHIHEADSAHTHESESAHTHEADPAQTHNDENLTASSVSLDYSSEKITLKTFHYVKRVSGTILPDKKGEVSILATSSGVLTFADQFIYPGIKVNEGTKLFTISGADLTEDNPEIKYKQVVADYNKARENLSRAERLKEDKLITDEHYLDAKNEFEKAEAEFSVYNMSDKPVYGDIKAPQTCFIKDVLVEEGQYVRAGDKLLTIQAKSKLVLRADIPPSDLDIRAQIKSAKFTTGYSDRVYNTEDLNGKLISYGRSGSNDSFYIPVFFKIDFTEELIPGTFADIWLIGEDIEDAVVIPNSAIMEEFGKFYVFLDHEGHFDKRFIQPGNSDGQFTRVLSGLNESDMLVTQGTYQVKMSMMSSIPNTHDHSH